MKKVSVNKKIVNYLTKAGPKTSRQLIEELKLPSSRVYNEIFKLVKTGTVVKNADKTVSMVVKPPASTSKEQIRHMVERSAYEAKIDSLTHQVRSALAVITYLESKLFDDSP
jgi:predicted transcriptional regulator